jgi:hypothetical protein
LPPVLKQASNSVLNRGIKRNKVLRKIISGGQTGADQAALDAAIKYGMPHGGWIPKGRKTEKGVLPSRYQMEEMKTGRYSRRTRQNVLDSDGSIIFFYEKVSGGTKYTWKTARKHKKPFMLINLCELPAFQAVSAIWSWVCENSVGVVNVAGPRARKSPRIYEAVKFIVGCVVLLAVCETGSNADVEKTNPGEVHHQASSFPKTLDEAANRLISELPHVDKIVIANMEVDDLEPVHMALKGLIRHQLNLDKGNPGLIQSCRDATIEGNLDKDGVPTVVVHSAWEKLRQNEALRLLR